MHPILGTIGPFTFHTYSVLVNVGVLAALIWLAVTAPEGDETRRLDAGLAAAAGGFVGARSGYVLANGAYFVDHLGEALAVWSGGLSWPGAAAGVIAGLWLYGRRRQLPVLPLIDAIALPAGLLAALAWGGCLAAGCAYGVEVVPGRFPVSLTAYAPDMYGLTLPRWPTQTAGLAYSLIALAVLYTLRGRTRAPGAMGLSALALTALGAVLLGLTRADPMPEMGGLRLDLWASLTVLLASLAGLLALRLRSHGTSISNPQSPVSNP